MLVLVLPVEFIARYRYLLLELRDRVSEVIRIERHIMRMVPLIMIRKFEISLGGMRFILYIVVDIRKQSYRISYSLYNLNVCAMPW